MVSVHDLFRMLHGFAELPIHGIAPSPCAVDANRGMVTNRIAQRIATDRVDMALISRP